MYVKKLIVVVKQEKSSKIIKNKTNVTLHKTNDNGFKITKR